DGKGYFTLNGAEPLGHLEVSIGLISTYARDVLELRGGAGAPAFFRVSDFVTAQLQAALGLLRWAELGVSLPVHLSFGSTEHGTFGAQMIGDVGLHPKFRLLPSRAPVGLALLTSIYLPTGDAEHFFGEGGVSLRPELILDRAFGRSRRIRL